MIGPLQPASEARIGTAGWSIPKTSVGDVPGEGTHLQRYAARFVAAEINSSFHRPHRRSTYERWAASVPAHFRFSVKLPKAATHQRKLMDCEELLVPFADQIAGLGAALGPVLVQLPPSLAFSADTAEPFFEMATALLGSRLVCEPRHASWFDASANAMLRRRGVARVAADPAITPAAARPGGWPGLQYFRLHGSPAMYRSPYDRQFLEGQCAAIVAGQASGAECWTIFDNTALGEALPNALALSALLGEGLTSCAR